MEIRKAVGDHRCGYPASQGLIRLQATFSSKGFDGLSLTQISGTNSDRWSWRLPLDWNSCQGPLVERLWGLGD